MAFHEEMQAEQTKIHDWSMLQANPKNMATKE